MTPVNLFQKHGERQAVAAGTVILRAGEPGATMYVVIAGMVDILVDETTVATAGPGGIIGDMALATGRPCSATAVARTACTLAAIDAPRFAYPMEQTPFFGAQVVAQLSERLDQANRRVLDATP